MMQAGATYPLTVRAADNGTPSQNATQSFSVTVLRPAQPQLTAPLFRSNGFNMRINGDTGPDYSVYATTNLANIFSGWQWLLTTNPAVLPFQFSDAPATNFRQRYYRVLLGP